MTTDTPINEGFCITIGIWALLMTLMTVHAVLLKRPSLSADDNDSSLRDKKGVELVLPASNLRTAWSGAPASHAFLLPEPDEEDSGTTAIRAHMSGYQEAAIHLDLESGKLHAIEGTVQRINNPAKELSVVAEGQVWNFTLDPECQLWFDNKPTVLRCFHPLDNVKIIFADDERTHVIKALYAWENQLA